jgi:hypothetical protein
MVNAEGGMEAAPQVTFWLAHIDMGRVSQPKAVATVANLFMGVQIQCAECHKHPFVDKWKQEDFWSLAAFFVRTRADGIQNNRPPNEATISETAPSNNTGRGRRPGSGFSRTPSGAVIDIPDPIDPRRRTGKSARARFFEGDEPRLDKAPYRPALADWLTAADNKYFDANAVNRLWAKFFARGFINPLDDINPDNPPSHPEVLKLLADEFRASGCDFKHVIRCICNSKAYQRSSKPLPENVDDVQFFSHMPIKVMHPEVLYDSLTLALDTRDLGSVSSGRGFGGGGGFRGGSGGGRQSFVSFFTTKEEGDDPTDFSLGVPQFLRLMNSAQFNRGGPVIDRLARDDATPEQVVEGLFLAALSRRPTEAELKKMTDYVKKKDNPRDGYNGVLWVLLNSAEFVCIR